MKLLLDTHALVWWHEDNPRMTEKIRRAITEADQVYVSVVSLWEIAIKISIGKFRLSAPDKLHVLTNDFSLLDLRFPHFQRIMKLPWHHRDPFDRMIVAQCQCERLTLVTNDDAMLRYDVKRMEIK